MSLSNLGNTNILVLGKENVGKSIFLDYLNGKTSDPFYEKPNTSSKADVGAIRIGNWHSLFRTSPGQESRSRDKTIDSAFKRHNDLEGIIYVFDWGFTNIRDEVIQKLWQDEFNVQSIKDLRAKMLEIEYQDFEKITIELN